MGTDVALVETCMKIKSVNMKNFVVLLLPVLIAHAAVAQWVPINSGTSRDLNATWFTDGQTGYVVGDTGTILKTIDGGGEWLPCASETTSDLHSVCFTDNYTGYAVGSNGTILKTTNAGVSWTNLNSGKINTLYSVVFPSLNIGYAVGYGGAIVKTTDGGETWISQNSGTWPYGYLGSVFFTSIDTGYAAGGLNWIQQSWSEIIKTTDGGANWTPLYSEYSHDYYIGLSAVFFLDANTGYVAGGRGRILKTETADTNWTLQPSGTFFDLIDISFVRTETGTDIGYAVGRQGKIIKTIDGGNTWVSQTSDTSNIGTFKDIFLLSADMGYAVGSGGLIRKTINGGGVGISDKSMKSSLLKVYPNPASDLVTIETPSGTQNNTVTIADVHGQVVATRSMNSHKIRINISALTRGVYFLKVYGEGIVPVGKFIKN